MTAAERVILRDRVNQAVRASVSLPKRKTFKPGIPNPPGSVGRYKREGQWVPL